MEQWALIRSYLKQGGRFENCHSRLPFDHHIHAYHAVCACACVWACARAHIHIHTHTTHMYQLEFLTFEAMDCWKACGNTAPGPQKTQSRAFFFCPDSVPQPLELNKSLNVYHNTLPAFEFQFCPSMVHFSFLTEKRKMPPGWKLSLSSLSVSESLQHKAVFFVSSLEQTQIYFKISILLLIMSIHMLLWMCVQRSGDTGSLGAAVTGGCEPPDKEADDYYTCVLCKLS